MTDKEFQAMLTGKEIKWGGADRANEALKKKPNLPDELAKKKAKKKKKENA